MKKYYLILLVFIVTSCNGQKKKEYDAYETTSKVKITTYDSLNQNNLELLGRIWGFLKYHHPNVAKGHFNWDFELFEILMSYKTVTTNAQRDELLLQWINSLGDYGESNPKQSNSEEIKIESNLSWIHDYNISKSLKEKIQHIYNNRHQGKQHYIKMVSFIGNPKFINEATYENMKYPDDGFSLLTLFRYWNAVNYFYPYKYATDKHWDIVLKEYIPVFLEIENELDFELALLKLISEINDSHANIIKGGDKITSWYGKNQSSVIVEFVENKLVVTGFYNSNLNKSNLKIGDVILEINNEPIDSIVSKLSPYTSASNKPALLRKIAKNILRSNEESLLLKVMTPKGEETTTINLYAYDEINFEEWIKKITNNTYKIIEGNIGYIPAVSVKDGEIKQIMKLFKNTKGIVIDLRYYPNTTDLLYKLAPYFMSEKKRFVKFSRGNLDNPGEFVFSEPLKFSKNKNYYKNKLIVLVNENTQSLGEYMAMVYQTGHNTTILGSTTSGADGDVSYLDLPGGIKTLFTGIGVYYPDGTETQRVGIKQNVVITPTIKAIRNNRDELLDKAIELILE